MLLYIDPGTGSMLFTVLLGVIGASVYSVRMLFMKMRYRVGGKKESQERKKIPLVIYSDDKRYWSVFAPICEELNRRGKEVVYYTGSEDDKALQTDLPNVKAECIGKGNRSFAKLNYLNASVVLSTTPGLEVYQWKKSKDVSHYVHIPHAASEITLYRMFGIDYYDAILLSGDYQIADVRKLEALRNLPPKELVKVGIPYMDEMAKRLKNAAPMPAHERTVLLAPSWGPSAIFSVYGAKIIEELLNTGYHIIIRPHPQSFESEKELISSLMEQFPESDCLEWNRDSDNFDVLRRADILISDFSGVIFDFTLVYDKPVIYTDPDFDTGLYDAWWLEDPLWTLSALPRLGKQLSGNAEGKLKDLIDACLEDPTFSRGRDEVRCETWSTPLEGAKNVVDYVLSLEEK